MTFPLAVKCFTKVVLEGSYKVNVPEPEWSFSVLKVLNIFWVPVPFDNSSPVLYSNAVDSVPPPVCSALKKEDVFATL